MPPAARRRFALLVLAGLALVLSGCGAGGVLIPQPTRPTQVTGTPTGIAKPVPSPTHVKPGSRDWYLNRIPAFPVAPTPVRVTLPHAPGRAAFAGQLATNQPVAFLTIDDGLVKAPDAAALLYRAGIHVTLFLTINDISDDPAYFTGLEDTGAVIEAHTISHPELPGLGYDAQRYEICHGADVLGQWYGRRPVLFRPPYGDENDNTLRAAASCGLPATFSWRETVVNGQVRYQTTEHKIHPGDIILMHFRTTFDEDFVAALRAIAASGLIPALLEDYVQLAPTSAVNGAGRPATHPAALRGCRSGVTRT